MTTVSASVDVEIDPSTAFDVVVEELVAGLRRLQIDLDPRPGGRVTDREADVGRVVAWDAGVRALFEWRPADWAPDEVTEIELRFEAIAGGTCVTVEHRGWGGLPGDHGNELAGWFAGEVAAPLLSTMGPTGFGDWLTDRRARRPAGSQARAVYRDPIYHRPNFRAILSALALTADDCLVEVGCGGGALLEEALRSGCRAKAVDHSANMVSLARDVNQGAVAEGRLEILEASADRLPFPDASFTCAAMTSVLPFLPDPIGALAEILRVLAVGGRLVLFPPSPEARGTAVAPEPIARRLRFYEDAELKQLAGAAGLVNVRVERPDLLQFARESGLPEEQLPFFAGRDGQLLLASKG